MNEVQAKTAECQTHGTYGSVYLYGRWSRCPTCLKIEKSAEDVIYAEEQARERAASRIRACLTPIRYHAATLAASEHKDAINRFLLSVLERRPVSLILLGNVGTGKTWLACALAHEAAGRNIEARYESVTEYLRRIRETWDSSELKESDVFRRASEIQLLILDELGIEQDAKMTARISDLIDARYTRSLPTVYISNLAPDKLKLAIGERSYDRIRDGATIIKMLGESRRKPA